MLITAALSPHGCFVQYAHGHKDAPSNFIMRHIMHANMLFKAIQHPNTLRLLQTVRDSSSPMIVMNNVEGIYILIFRIMMPYLQH